MAGVVAAATARYPRAPALVDDDGPMTFTELWDASDGMAASLRRRGVGPTSTVGILARNHRGFVTSVVAAAKLGTDMVFLNTGFAGPQLADVVAHEGIDTVLHDDEYTDIVEGCGAPLTVVGQRDRGRRGGAPVRPAGPNRRAGRMVILTSGTTGRPKGAARTRAAAAPTGSRRCCRSSRSAPATRS